MRPLLTKVNQMTNLIETATLKVRDKIEDKQNSPVTFNQALALSLGQAAILVGISIASGKR